MTVTSSRRSTRFRAESGLTAWLNQTYSTFDKEIIGGSDGMLDGFQNVLPNGGDIVISQEASTYRPEMEWIAARLKDRSAYAKATGDSQPQASESAAWRVVAAENYEPQDGRAVYRFFELFDLSNIPNIDNLLRANAEGRVTITPPIKPFLEEKIWFALFWLKPLHEFWRRELGEKYFTQLQKVIPYSWLLDPTPLPQHAVIPRLEIHDWREAAKFSQKDRDLLLKVSGFSPLGWGSRGGLARVRSRPCRMGKADQQCAGDFRLVAHDPAALSQGPPARTSLLGCGVRRIEKR